MKSLNIISSIIAFAIIIVAATTTANEDHDCCNQRSSIEICHELKSQPETKPTGHSGALKAADCDIDCCGMIINTPTLSPEASEHTYVPLLLKWALPVLSQTTYVTGRIQPRPPKPLI